MNLLDLARSALPAGDAVVACDKSDISAVSPKPRTATPAEADELRALIARILPGDPAGQAEALPIACADPDAAITCFRALVADLPADAAPLPTLPELPTCEQCRHLTTARDRDGFRRCRAAARGELDGVHSRYCPDAQAGRRCLSFAPPPGDADQRNGAERWPWLAQPPRGGVNLWEAKPPETARFRTHRIFPVHRLIKCYSYGAFENPRLSAAKSANRPEISNRAPAHNPRDHYATVKRNRNARRAGEIPDGPGSAPGPASRGEHHWGQMSVVTPRQNGVRPKPWSCGTNCEIENRPR